MSSRNKEGDWDESGRELAVGFSGFVGAVSNGSVRCDGGNVSTEEILEEQRARAMKEDMVRVQLLDEIDTYFVPKTKIVNSIYVDKDGIRYEGNVYEDPVRGDIFVVVPCVDERPGHLFSRQRRMFPGNILR